jgi:hypothetical protein
MLRVKESVVVVQAPRNWKVVVVWNNALGKILKHSLPFRDSNTRIIEIHLDPCSAAAKAEVSPAWQQPIEEPESLQ